MLPSSLALLLRQKTPCMWRNARWQPIGRIVQQPGFGPAEVHDAAGRMQRFAPLLAMLFPELESSGGIIESELHDVENLRNAILGRSDRDGGRWFIKGDHALPVAGSIKARGGIFEVLVHAATLAEECGFIAADRDYAALASAPVRELFAAHEVVVGSTGNLGLSIGITAAALGFRATVHMSADAKPWKKALLRARGVDVIEHAGDFGAAVAAGRRQASTNPSSYFVDDENSRHLFFGYSVAAIRLQAQLLARGIAVGAENPLFVYIPCGVGGAPGGITFGLRQLLGDHVHCFLAEPVASPCMLVRLAAEDDRPVNVRDLGLDNHTEADGLAVAQASELAARMLRPLAAGAFTVPESDFFGDLFTLERTTGLRVEPSAAAAIRGPRWLLDTQPGREFLVCHGLLELLPAATHVIWTTGGAFVPENEYRAFHDRGRRLRGE